MNIIPLHVTDAVADKPKPTDKTDLIKNANFSLCIAIFYYIKQQEYTIPEAVCKYAYILI